MNKFVIIVLLVFYFGNISAQENKKLTLDGYITNMQSVIIDSLNGNWINDNLVHNRLNFRYNPSPSLSFGLDIRNRIFTGEAVKYYPGYGDNISKDVGLVDLSTNWLNKNSVVINSNIDRAWFKYEKNKFALTLGRQRINWGRTLAWNPNDIFNSYSFFDFDYVEKPGSDALRIQYYPGALSTVEVVAKIDSSNTVSAAGLFRFNLLNWDVQILGGMINEQDYVLGAGWEGNLRSVSFRGEASYIHPKENLVDTSGLIVATVSFDYVFSNSLMLQAEFLYNPQKGQKKLTNFGEFYSRPLTIKNLSFTEYNIFLSVNYPISPLFSMSFSTMYFPKLNGWYAGPGLSYSLKENLDFSIFVQSFQAKLPDPISGNDVKQSMSLAFLRLKLSF